jgi:hypothetical protein
VNAAAAVVKPATVADAAVNVASVAATGATVAQAQARQLLTANHYGAFQLQQVAGLMQRRLRASRKPSSRSGRGADQSPPGQPGPSGEPGRVDG